MMSRTIVSVPMCVYLVAGSALSPGFCTIVLHQNTHITFGYSS